MATTKLTSPGRIKQVTRLANGAWNVTDIDGNFTPQLSVPDHLLGRRFCDTRHPRHCALCRHRSGRVSWIARPPRSRAVRGEPDSADRNRELDMAPLARDSERVGHRASGAPELPGRRPQRRRPRSNVRTWPIRIEPRVVADTSRPTPDRAHRERDPDRRGRSATDACRADRRAPARQAHVRSAPFEIAPGDGAEVVLEAPAEIETRIPSSPSRGCRACRTATARPSGRSR